VNNDYYYDNTTTNNTITNNTNDNNSNDGDECNDELVEILSGHERIFVACEQEWNDDFADTTKMVVTS
jgi:hypothetical protein